MILGRNRVLKEVFFFFCGGQGTLAPGVATLAEALQAGGYRTYVTGKWNLGLEPYNLPPARGFGRSLIQGDTGSDNFEPAKGYLPHPAKVRVG